MTTEYEKRQRKEAIERIKVAQQKHRATLQAERDEAIVLVRRWMGSNLVDHDYSLYPDTVAFLKRVDPLDTRKFLEGIK